MWSPVHVLLVVAVAACALRGAEGVTCGTAQIPNALGGCTSCASGKVASGTTCVACPAGTAKVPAGVVANAACLAVTEGGCGTSQYTSGTGICLFCPVGQVTNGTGSGCRTCEAGTAKSPAGSNVVNAICDRCPSTIQYASGTGVCLSCTQAGTVANAAGTACEPCPAGSVRVPPSGITGAALSATCVPVTQGGCGTAQFANGTGLCRTCGAGQVTSADGASCQFCPAGTAKVPAGIVVNAACARCSGSAQFANSASVCVACPAGQVANAAGTGCEPCPAGTARVPPSGITGAALNAKCVPVRQGGCGTAQFANGTGLCQTCGAGQVGNADGTGCTRCPPGTGKVPASAVVVNATCVQCAGNTTSNGSGICTSCPRGVPASPDHTFCGDGVLITGPGEAYGHHGECQGWNGCGDAATCALLACRAKGYNKVRRYGESKPCTQFRFCNLFICCNHPLVCQGLCDYDPCTKGVQYGWGTGCDVLGVTDIVCYDATFFCPASSMAPQLMVPRPMMAAAAAGAKEGPDPTASSETMAAFEAINA